MKKNIAVILCLIMCLTSVCVGAASVPSFMNVTYNNYTADYTVSVRIDNADEIVSFLKEIEMPDEVNNYFNIKTLIESLASSDSSMNVRAEISEDFRKIKVALTGESKQTIVLNRNFNTSSEAKMGVWISMDVDSRELVVICSTPVNEKYAVIDFSKDVPSEICEMIFSAYDKMFNKDFMSKISSRIMDAAVKYADVSMNGNTCTVKFDNDAFVSAMSEVSACSVELVSAFVPELNNENVLSDIPSFEGVKILGEEGLTCIYNLNKNKIKSVIEKYDISFSISDIYTKLTGFDWEYNFSGDIDLTIDCRADVKCIGTTHVALPEITEENSFSVVEMFMEKYEEYETDEPEMPYVSDYVWGTIEKDTYDGEKYYLPVRYCVESMYYESASISYDRGLVTIVTDCRNKDLDINASFSVGDTYATVNGVVYEDLGAFKMIDGSVYASVDFFEKCLGWELTYLSKNILDGSLTYDFYTY